MSNRVSNLSGLTTTLEKDARITRLEEEWRNLLAVLLTLQQELAESFRGQKKIEEAMLDAFRSYAPLARRYSFTARPH